jgi:hypothetical protein
MSSTTSLTTVAGLQLHIVENSFCFLPIDCNRNPFTEVAPCRCVLLLLNRRKMQTFFWEL